MAWEDSVGRIPLYRLVLGVLAAWGIALGVGVWLVIVPPFDERVRIDIVGEVEAVRTPEVMEHPVLDVALKGQPIRFRAGTRVFKEAFQEQPPAKLQPGATAHLTVEKVKYENPSTPMPDRVPTVAIDALQVDGAQLLTLDISRRLAEENRLLAKIGAPIAGAVALFISWCLRLKLRTSG